MSRCRNGCKSTRDTTHRSRNQGSRAKFTDRKDFIRVGVGSSLIKVDKQQSVVHEDGVIEQRRQESVEEISSVGDSGVMSIVQHVGGDEDVLGESVGIHISLKSFKALNVIKAGSIAVVKNRRAKIT